MLTDLTPAVKVGFRKSRPFGFPALCSENAIRVTGRPHLALFAPRAPRSTDRGGRGDSRTGRGETRTRRRPYG